MASGGFHGGSTHSGGFHSSGGGGSHGGGSGGYDSFDGGGPEEGLMMAGLIVLAITLYIFSHIQKGTIPGINLPTFSIYVITGFAFIPSIKAHKRFSALERVRLKYVVHSDRIIGTEFISPVRRGTKETWVGKEDKNYRISFREERFGDKNLTRVKEFMSKRPVIFLLWPKVFLIISIILFLSSPFIVSGVKYSLVPKPISVKRIDEIVYYVSFIPAGLAFLCPILSSIFVKIREKLLYTCAFKIVDENEKELAAEMH